MERGGDERAIAAGVGQAAQVVRTGDTSTSEQAHPGGFAAQVPQQSASAPPQPAQPQEPAPQTDAGAGAPPAPTAWTAPGADPNDPDRESPWR